MGSPEYFFFDGIAPVVFPLKRGLSQMDRDIPMILVSMKRQSLESIKSECNDDVLLDMPTFTTDSRDTSDSTGSVELSGVSTSKTMFAFTSKAQPTATPISSAGKFQCEQCQYSTNNSTNMKTHRLVHSVEKPHECDFENCGYRTKYAGDLKTHKLIHSSLKPFACDLCPYSSRYAGNLKSHMLVHSQNLPHFCKECPYKGRSAAALKNHRKQHNLAEERPFACNICPYTTTQKGHLKTHLRVHSGERPFICKLCPYKSSQRGNLKIHCHRIHGVSDL